MIKITKKGLKAWVTFSVKPNEGEVISLCGEWNDWKNEPMKVKKVVKYILLKYYHWEKAINLDIV